MKKKDILLKKFATSYFADCSMLIPNLPIFLYSVQQTRLADTKLTRSNNGRT